MARRREPATELDEAKTALQHDDIRATLKHAERARRLFLEREDLAGLDSVLAFLATVPSDQQSDRVTYATRQNIRFVGRGVALKEGGPYEDPFPARSTSTPDPPVTRRELATRIAWLVSGFALIGVLGWSIVTPRVTQWFRCNQGNVGAPSISPDGTRIVFARCEHAGVRLVVTRIDGSNPTVMSNLGEAQMPSWSPDGRSVLWRDSDQRAGVRRPGRTRRDGAFRPASCTFGLRGSSSGSAPNDAARRSAGASS